MLFLYCEKIPGETFRKTIRKEIKMETGFIILVAITVLALVTIFILGFVKKKKPDETQGIIYAYCNESGTDPSLLLEYSVPINDITSRKRVTFDVKVIR
jgi:hypothetical protein